MLKRTSKTIIALIAILLILSSVCFAATTNSKDTTFEIVEDKVCTIKINDVATFEKKIKSYDLDKKEVDLQLKITNNTEPVFGVPTEIMFVMDNSRSMVENNVSTNVTRMQAVVSAAKRLATSLLANDNVKIGIVSYSTGPLATEGTMADATLRLEPSNSSSAVLAAIDQIATDTETAKANEEDKYIRTDIEAGLTLGAQTFTDNAEAKYMVLLTDGIPNISLEGNRITYSGTTATRTKAKLEALAADGVTIFSIMTGVNPQSVEMAQTNLTYKELAEEVFGTEEEPTVGKFYYITDSQIERTITETVLNNFEDTSTTLTNVKIYDYFPQYIIDNFDFSYVSEPTKGTISAEIDKENRRIIWTIDELKPQETLTVVYKLKLKDKVDEKIIGEILDTNEKVDITVDQYDDPFTSTDTPKVRIFNSKVIVKYLEKGTNKELAPNDTITGKTGDNYTTERKTIQGYKAADPEPTNAKGTLTKDPITVIYYYQVDVAPGVIPQTGDNNTLLIVTTIAVITALGFGIRAYIVNKK